MIPYDEMQYHPTAERVVEILCHRTQQTDPLFFRVLVAYYFAATASHMRCSIESPDRGNVPINLYALNLAVSGFGKGLTTNVMEEEVLNQFRDVFLEQTFPLLAEQNLPKLANKRAVRKGTDPDDELVKLQKEFEGIGDMYFSFCDATTPAIKTMRHKLLLAGAGALNLEVDEIGNNLTNITEALDTYLELFDKGKTKPKLVLNTNDRKRVEEIKGAVAANLMMFGTPTKLFDGAATEQQLYTLLDSGYARRCFFGYLPSTNKYTGMTAEEVFNLHTANQNSTYLEDLSDRLGNLADIINANKKLIVSKDTSIKLIEYRLECEKLADKLPEHESLRKAEMAHRYWKVLKLAGAYAFIDDLPEITEQHLYNAIKLAEDCGEAFNRMLTRDRPYVKLAKYLANVKREVTQAELVEDLPFYKGSVSTKGDMLNLAIAYGYKNNIVIKKSYSDGIEFLRGETLEETDIKRMVLSYSNEITENFRNEYAPFDQLHKLTQTSGMHWVSHHLNGGYRNEENALAGFNLVVVDVDGGTPMSTAKLLLKDHKFLMYTTKRHTDEDHRYRIIFPTNYKLELDAKDYREFMNNIFEWLPFEVDRSTGQRARKWLSHDGHYEYNDGDLLDVLPFIPKTSKNEARKQLLDSQQSLDNLERWVMNNIGDGNRNNMLLRYAMILVDADFSFDAIRQKVSSLNDKIPDKLDEAEIIGTIMVTVGKAIAQRP